MTRQETLDSAIEHLQDAIGDLDHALSFFQVASAVLVGPPFRLERACVGLLERATKELMHLTEEHIETMKAGGFQNSHD